MLYYIANDTDGHPIYAFQSINNCFDCVDEYSDGPSEPYISMVEADSFEHALNLAVLGFARPYNS